MTESTLDGCAATLWEVIERLHRTGRRADPVLAVHLDLLSRRLSDVMEDLALVEGPGR